MRDKILKMSATTTFTFTVNTSTFKTPTYTLFNSEETLSVDASTFTMPTCTPFNLEETVSVNAMIDFFSSLETEGQGDGVGEVHG